MTFDELREKAHSLPMAPGVYLMQDRTGKVIYVGKAKALRNRVSQYFQRSRKDTKTDRMVNSVDDFEYIVCSTEIEALSLENTLTGFPSQLRQFHKILSLYKGHQG